MELSIEGSEFFRSYLQLFSPAIAGIITKTSKIVRKKAGAAVRPYTLTYHNMSQTSKLTYALKASKLRFRLSCGVGLLGKYVDVLSIWLFSPENLTNVFASPTPGFKSTS
jgi:hypothetical protein